MNKNKPRVATRPAIRRALRHRPNPINLSNHQEMKTVKPGFKMKEFLAQIEKRQNEVDEQLFDTLISLVNMQ